ncbi:hypothetical protein R5R35_001281 [Gryllus longicercus]|uniref:Sm domain-containing protein n=2 Tax=Gryllus longicercus TaxID=2509291 RepID=A0AAN9VX76_9ORTH
MKNDKEIVGTLLGFDDFVNMLLEDVTEYESTPEGRRITKLDQILLNENSGNIHLPMSYKIIEAPVISIQCDWNETLRSAKGEAWVSCKYRGQNSAHGKITSQGLSQGIPSLTVTDNFVVDSISKSTIQIKYLSSSTLYVFIAPDRSYNSAHNKSVISCDVTPNGLCVSACTDNKLQVWDTKTGVIRRTLEGHVGNVYKCRFFPSGIVALSGGADMQLKIWSAETGQCPVTLSGHTAAITDFCIVERGRNIISVSKDGFAKLWDCGMSACLADLVNHKSAINCCCLTVTSGNIKIEDPEIASSNREIGTKDKLLIVGCEDGGVFVVAVWNRKEIQSQSLESAVNCITSLGDQYLVGCQNGQILMFKIGEGVNEPALCWFESNSAILSVLCYNEIGFFAGRADGSCTYFDVSSDHEHRIQLTGPDCDPIYDIAFDGTFIYTACRDAVVRKYDVAKVIESIFMC